jgi:hypothetical protein
MLAISERLTELRLFQVKFLLPFFKNGSLDGMCALLFCQRSALGAVGINAVLMKAATGLESRQEAKYGLTTEYRVWLQQAWGGFHTHTPTPLFDEANEMTEADRRRCAETGECPVE